jgi:hypothetical protein
VLFIYPMWDNENQRLGLQACTPVGYALRGIGELIGFLRLLLLLGTLVVVTVLVLALGFKASSFWLLLIPFGVGVLSEGLVCLGWTLAKRRRFEYDPETRIATWIENGERVTFQKYR